MWNRLAYSIRITLLFAVGLTWLPFLLYLQNGKSAFVWQSSPFCTVEILRTSDCDNINLAILGAFCMISLFIGMTLWFGICWIRRGDTHPGN